MECHTPLSEAPESPALSYSMAVKEGRRIVGLLEELMSTPLADTQQPSLVDFSLTSTPESGAGGGTLQPPRCKLFSFPTPPSLENRAAPCVGNLLDTTNPNLSGLNSALTRALEELNLSSGDIDKPEVGELECSSFSLISITNANATSSSETQVDRKNSHIVNNAELDVKKASLLEKESNGITPFASPVAAFSVDKESPMFQVKGPLVPFSPATSEPTTKPACDRTIQSGSGGVLASLAVDDSSTDVVLNGCANSTMGVTTNPATAVNKASPAAAATVLDGGIPTVAVDRCNPVVPELLVEDSLVTAGDDSFRTAYGDSPLLLSRRSLVVWRDEPVAGDGPLASCQDVLSSALDDGSNPATEPAAESTFAVPDSPLSARPATGAPTVAADTTFPTRDSPPSGGLSAEVATAAAETTFAIADSLPSDSPATEAAAETTFACPAPVSKPAPRPPVASTVQASSAPASDTTMAVASRASLPGKSVSKPAKGVSLQTRKSLLPPPATSQRPGRPSTLVKPRAPLGRHIAASRAAEETFAANKTAHLASPQTGAPQTKQEQASARPRLSFLPRKPLVPPPTRGPSAAGIRQSMPAPGVKANGVTKHAAGRMSAVAKTVTAGVPSTSSVPARTARLTPPTTSAAAGARTASSLGLPKLSAPAAPRGGSTKALPRPNGKAPAETETQTRTQAGLPRSRIAAPKTRAAGFSRLPTMAGSSANNRAALLTPLPESPLPERLSSTPVRSDIAPLDAAACPELTPIRRQ